MENWERTSERERENWEEIIEKLLCLLVKTKMTGNLQINSIQMTNKEAFPVLLSKTTINREKFMDRDGIILDFNEFGQMVMGQCKEECSRGDETQWKHEQLKASHHSQRIIDSKGSCEKADESSEETEGKKVLPSFPLEEMLELSREMDETFENLGEEILRSLQEGKKKANKEFFGRTLARDFLKKVNEKESKFVKEIEKYVRETMEPASEKVRKVKEKIMVIKERGRLLVEAARNLTEELSHQASFFGNILNGRTQRKRSQNEQQKQEKKTEENPKRSKGKEWSQNEYFKDGMSNQPTRPFLSKNTQVSKEEIPFRGVLSHFELNEGMSRLKTIRSERGNNDDEKLHPSPSQIIPFDYQHQRDEAHFRRTLKLDEASSSFFKEVLSHYCQSPFFELIFQASSCGFKASKFHESCDGKGATLTIIKNHLGKIFGGFASEQWRTPIISQNDFPIYTKAPGKKINEIEIYSFRNSAPVFSNEGVSRPIRQKAKFKNEPGRTSLGDNETRETKEESGESNSESEKSEKSIEPHEVPSDFWRIAHNSLPLSLLPVEECCPDRFAVLFSFDLKAIFPQTKNFQQALLHCRTYGPSFGFGGDILVSDDCDHASSYMNMNGTFDSKGFSLNEISGGHAFKILDYAVYLIKT